MTTQGFCGQQTSCECWTQMNLSPFCFRVPSLHALQHISGILFPTKTEGKFYQSLSCIQLFATPWTAARQASPSFTTSWSLLKLMSIKSVMPSDHLLLCCPLLLLPSIFPSISLFQWVSSLHQVAKVLRVSASVISHSSEYSGFISFRIDCFDFPAVQGTPKSLL